MRGRGHGRWRWWRSWWWACGGTRRLVRVEQWLHAIGHLRLCGVRVRVGVRGWSWGWGWGLGLELGYDKGKGLDPE